MRPFIDISHVANDPTFINLDRVFGLVGRLNLYNSAKTDPDALRYLETMSNVLDRDDFARDQIRQRGLAQAAGSALAAIDYARRTIQGHPPAAPFNAQSTPDRLVLTP